MAGASAMTTTGSIQQLILDLDSSVEKTRMDAASALGRMGLPAKAAVPALTIVVCSGQRVVSWAAANALRKIGLTDADSIASIVVAHADERVSVRKPAAHALAAVGPEAHHATQALCRFLDDRRAPVREAACYALGRIGPDASDALPKLAMLLDDHDFHVRRQCKLAISAINDSHSTDVAVRRAEFDADERVRTDHDLFESGEIPLEQTQAARSLAELIKSNDTTERCEAVRSLSHTEQVSENILLHLEEALRDPSPRVREAAAYTIGEIGPDAKPLAPGLLQVLRDKDQDVRKAAFFAIHKIVH